MTVKELYMITTDYIFIRTGNKVTQYTGAKIGEELKVKSIEVKQYPMYKDVLEVTTK